MGKKNFICLEKWPEFDEKKIDAEVLKQEEIFKKICEDVQAVIKLSKKNKNLYLYVLTEKELLWLQQSFNFLKKELFFSNIKVLLAKDPKKYDLENKAKRAKFGKPGIYIE
jgi:leucyl-tRNA synthetase